MNTEQPAWQTEARGAITDTLHRYAFLANESLDVEVISKLWSDDGAFVLPDGTVVPPTALYRIAAGAAPTFIRHHITTSVIDFSDAQTANVESYFMAYTDLAQPDHWGRWSDVLRREADGRWLFTRKQPIVEGFASDGFWAKSQW